MNKRELIAASARRSRLSQRTIRDALDAVLETIADAMGQGEPVTVAEFGRFLMQRYPGRRLPRFDGSGHFNVEDRMVPVWKSSEALRRRLREKA